MLGFITEEYNSFLTKVGEYYATAQDSLPMIVEDDEDGEFAGGYV